MNQMPRVPWKRCMEWAIQDLTNRSLDGLALSQIWLKEAGVSLPLVKVIEKRKSFWMRNKKCMPLGTRTYAFFQNELVADQANTMSSLCIEYLVLRMKESCGVIAPPPDPWNILGGYVGALQSKELMSFADQVRGVLETIAGVIFPDPPDLEAMKLVGEIVLQFLNEESPQSIKLLDQSLVTFSSDDTAILTFDKFYSTLFDIAKCLEQGQLNKIREYLVTVRQVLDMIGKSMPNKLIDIFLQARS